MSLYETQILDTLNFPLWGSRLIEASAGTGKTYTIAALYLRLILGHGEMIQGRALTPPDILVVTFTRAATQELRDRIRLRLTQAAAFFLDEDDGDEFLHDLRSEYDASQWPGCARLLQLAAEWMDDAAVSTIDAWCYRMLREHAFQSAGYFDVEMDVDDAEIIAEATRDYWRLFIAPLRAEEFRLVLGVLGKHRANWKSSADCDGLTETLRRRWLREGAEYSDAASPAELLGGLRERLMACKNQWGQWVPELRTLLQEAYDDNLYTRSALRVNVWKGTLDKLEEWANTRTALQPAGLKLESLAKISFEGLKAIWKAGTPPAHPGFFAVAELYTELRNLPEETARILPHAANWVGRRVDSLRRQRCTLGFSSLQAQLGAALAGPEGDVLAAAIRAQFPVALVDEFQDTSPLQYRLFDSIYNVDSNDGASLLALIGDPKQAIYRFRGADIHAYLAARRACMGRLYTLGDNYRSSASMVAAVNHLFESAESQREQGAFLFREEAGANPVPFVPVRAAADPGTWEVEGREAAALTVWCDASFSKAKECESAVAQSCASEVLRLLELGRKDRAGFRRDGAFRSLQTTDIAILVNTGTEAALLRAALAERGIRSVYLSDDGSVYEGMAAHEVLSWLRACAEPDNAAFVRAALATAGLDLDWGQLDALVRDDQLWETMLERFAGYKEHWRRSGVLPMLRRFMQDFSVPARLLGAGVHQEGERRLTDYLHLAELLQAASAKLDGEHAVIRFLEACIEQQGGERDLDGDVSRMRLESDAGLVQVVTVHKSKGLEYPLVFYPYAYQARPTKPPLELPVAYRDRQGVERLAASAADLTDEDQAQALASLEHERLAEDLRKLYVALTRARHATWIALAPVDTLALSAVGHVLGGPTACTAEGLAASLDSWANASPHISIQPFTDPQWGRFRADHALASPSFAWREMQRRITQRWSLSSYSALVRTAVQHGDSLASPQGEAPGPGLPDEARSDTFLEAYDAFDEDLFAMGTDVARDGLSGASGIHRFPRGAAAGSFLHGLLEWVFRQGAEQALNDHSALQALVLRRCRSRGWEVHADALTAWLIEFCSHEFHLPCPPSLEGAEPASETVPGGLRLRDLHTYLPEMEFWFGVQDTDLPTLDALVAEHFLPGMHRARLDSGRFNGMLRGFVDLVFEYEGRFYVADYKSNWLGPDAAAYEPGKLAAVVLEHRYDLQAALYLYALHKHLKSRLGGDYDYARHIGGALVFFMRGYAAASQGVHLERPSEAMMECLERLFENKEGRRPAREEANRVMS